MLVHKLMVHGSINYCCKDYKYNYKLAPEYSSNCDLFINKKASFLCSKERVGKEIFKYPLSAVGEERVVGEATTG